MGPGQTKGPRLLLIEVAGDDKLRLDGVDVVVEPSCDIWAALPHTDFKEENLRNDLRALAADYDVSVELRLQGSEQWPAYQETRGNLHNPAIPSRIR